MIRKWTDLLQTLALALDRLGDYRSERERPRKRDRRRSQVCSFAQSDWISESPSAEMDEAEIRFKTGLHGSSYAEAETISASFMASRANRLSGKSYSGRHLRNNRNMHKHSLTLD